MKRCSLSHTSPFLSGYLTKMAQKLLLRVVIDEDDIRKLILNERPGSVEELKLQLRDKL